MAELEQKARHLLKGISGYHRDIKEWVEIHGADQTPAEQPADAGQTPPTDQPASTSPGTIPVTPGKELLPTLPGNWDPWMKMMIDNFSAYHQKLYQAQKNPYAVMDYGMMNKRPESPQTPTAPPPQGQE